MKNWRGVFMLAILLSNSAPANAMLVERDGYAKFSILLITPELVIAFKDVSGMTNAELFAYEPKIGKVKWRQNCEGRPSGGIEDGSGAFFYDAENQLVKRNLKTGGLYWRTSLAAIPQQKSNPPVKITQRIKDKFQNIIGTPTPIPLNLNSSLFSGPPNCYYCNHMVISGSNLFISRSAVNHSGCTIQGCFNDWLLIDPWKGGLVAGGEGDFVGAAEGNLFLAGNIGHLIRNGRREDWAGYEKLKEASFENYLKLFDDTPDIYGAKYAATPKSYMSTEVLVLDKSGSIVASILPKTNLNGREKWLVLKNRLFHYCESAVFHAGLNPGPPYRWFELYEPDGRLLNSIQLNESPTRCEDHLEFLGVNSKGEPIFQARDSFWCLEIPSLRCTVSRRNGAMESVNESCRSYAMKSGSDVIYEVAGDFSIMKMKKTKMPHEISITALDATNFKQLWKYSETVTILRQAN